MCPICSYDFPPFASGHYVICHSPGGQQAQVFPLLFHLDLQIMALNIEECIMSCIVFLRVDIILNQVIFHAVQGSAKSLTYPYPLLLVVILRTISILSMFQPTPVDGACTSPSTPSTVALEYESETSGARPARPAGAQIGIL